MKEEIKINQSITLRNAMKLLNKTAEKCLLVVNENNKLKGTLTDGDIRRAILKGHDFKRDIKNIYNKSPFYVYQNKYKNDDLLSKMEDKKIDLVPVVNDQSIVVNYVTWSKLSKGKNKNKLLKNISVVIMAGGKGTRMQPFTKILPKPLIPIKNKTIIEHIIKQFMDFGIKNIFLTVNYKSRILKAYFEELKPNFNVKFVNEDSPLGTAGSLHLLKNKFKNSFFVTNCDIIAKLNYHSLYTFHEEGNYDITMVASAKQYTLPYGAISLDSSGSYSKINEKPQFDFLVNAGLYVLNPKILDFIPENKFYHITNLIEDLKIGNKRIGVFPIDEDLWIDIGQWEEYKKALNKI